MSSERQPPDDRELEDFLAGRHPVGKAYRDASQVEFAPPELDAAILQAARESVRTVRKRRPRWVQPVAVAATVTLSLGVLLNLWRDPETREQMAPGEEAPSAEALQEKALQAHAQAQADAEAAPQKESSSLAELAAEPPAASAALAAREQTKEEEAERKTDSQRARAERESDAKKRKQEGERDAANPVQEARKSKAPIADAPVIVAPPSSAAAGGATVSAPAPGAAASSPSTRAFVPEPPPAPAPPPPSASAPTAAGAMNRAEPAPVSPSASDDRLDSSSSRSRDEAPKPVMPMAKKAERSEPRSYSMQPSESAPSAETAAPAPAQQDAVEGVADWHAPADPPEWIRRIRELRAQGNQKGARDLLNSFRAQYPDYVLPDDLQKFVREK